MKNMQSKSILTLEFLFVLLIFSHLSSTQAHHEVEDENEYNYVRGGPIGPERWGKIKEEWSLCSTGKMQSPIDLSSKIVEELDDCYRLNINYKPSKATLVKGVHDITLEWEGDAGSVVIDSTNYALQEAHWHIPSEHAINGRIYDLEMHLVHKSIDNKTAVIAVLYTFGTPNGFLSKLEANLTTIIEQKVEHVDSGIINPRDIRLSTSNYYQYTGSLTTPPCTEHVAWVVSRKISTVSRRQVRLLRDAVDNHGENSARPLQPVNKRHVFYCDED